MRRLLNSLYILDETAYLTLDGENVVCRTEEKEKFRMPLANIEDIYCFSYLGCSPALRPGRSSLACDLVEESRCIIERLVLTMINLKKLNKKDFETQESGAVYLTKDGKKKVLTAWQEKKRTTITHPYINEKIPLGLLPFVQSSLLAKYIRGETGEYPCFLLK